MKLLQQFHICFLLLFSIRVCHSQITKLDSCLGEDAIVHRISAISLEKCKEECGKRPQCKAVNYRRNFQLCELLREDHGYILNNQGNRRSCVFVKKSEMSTGDLQACNCSDWTTCDVDTNTCRITECLRPMLANGRILGNMWSVGSRIRFTCNTGYVEKSGEKYAVCETSGEWSYQPECIRDCGTHPVIANAYIVSGGGSTVEGAVVMYGCKSGYILTGSINLLTCTDNGWFDQNDIVCVFSEPTIGKTCAADSDCLLLTGGQCVESKCFCSPLYRYNNTINDCSKVCTSFNNTFTALPNTNAYGYNDISDGQANTLAECTTLCMNDPNCLSFEMYEQNTKCTRGSVTYGMIYDADISSLTNTRHMYTRDCS